MASSGLAALMRQECAKRVRASPQKCEILGWPHGARILARDALATVGVNLPPGTVQHDDQDGRLTLKEILPIDWPTTPLVEASSPEQ